MIIKCPNCNGALEYDVIAGKMFCKFCGAYFNADEISVPYTGSSYANEEIAPQVMQQTQSEPQNTPVESAPQEETDSFRQYDSWEDLQDDALEARQSGKSGEFSYENSATSGASNRESYYEKQRRLHEEYQNRPKMDYSKPYAGTSRANMTDAERKKAIQEDKIRFERQRQELKKMYTIDAMGRSGAGIGPDSSDPLDISGNVAEMMVGKNVYETFTGVDPTTAADYAARKMASGMEKEPEYDNRGRRILSKVNMMVTTQAPREVGSFTLDNNVYTCTTCGAELSLSGVETSSFCAYCGQPTIVFSRMEKTTMPDHIIPFVVTKDQALKSIRAKLGKGILVPSEIKNFEVERLRGIYIPYWLYDAQFEDSMVIRTRVKSGKTSVTKYYRVDTDCSVFYYPVDASKRLNDSLSRKLEPYDYSGIRPFTPAYMSGFYADRFDMDADTMALNSMFRIQQLVYEKAKKKVPGSPNGLVQDYPVYNVQKQYYTLLPAWFMTFRYEGVPYTMLVNGQNGKVVGAVPYSKKKFWGLFGGVFAASALALVPLCMKMIPALLVDGGKNSFKVFAMIVIFILGMYFVGWGNVGRFNKSMELSREETITKFVKERQDM